MKSFYLMHYCCAASKVASEEHTRSLMVGLVFLD